ncbi:SNG1 family protein [Mycobacterium sp. 21AC1]|uniref:hypothetical protein n=1 Tax=[Mycobacterium] appelbergii TaxID=2939269 RepID=UPI002938E9DE|nr:hypothetical protein [Mycobacterium sp. 21AC1]MDV3126319.1 SNG1 family protein [Mycobacterium sp. 21AC1]
MGRHQAPELAHPRLHVTRAQARNVVMAMVALTMLVLAMTASYSGAFAKPVLHNLSVAVVAPQPMVDQLRGQPALEITEVGDDDAARDRILHRTADAALVVDAPGHMNVYVAGGGGRSVAAAAESVGRTVGTQTGLATTVTDIAPTSAGDPSGTVEFYAIIFVSIGASVGAAAFGRMVGSVRRPVTLALRTVTLTAYSALLAGVVTGYVDMALGALTGHPWQVFGTLWLYSMAVGGAVTGVAAAFGTVASMVLTAFLVIVGNAAAAGPVGRPLLSGFYTAFNHVVPQGSGVSLLRSIEYFDGHGALTPFATLTIWAAAGCLLAMLGTFMRLRPIADSTQQWLQRFSPGRIVNYRANRDRSAGANRAVLRPGVLSPAD